MGLKPSSSSWCPTQVMSLPCPTLLCYLGIMAPPFSKCGDEEVKQCLTGSRRRARRCLVAEAAVAARVADFSSQWSGALCRVLS